MNQSSKSFKKAEFKSHPHKKRWGQNFLKDKNILNKIVRTIYLTTKDSILEIGPGEGALSEKVLPKVKEMIAIEIDPLLISHLKSLSILDDLSLVCGDILDQRISDLPISKPVRVIGNIPYNITSPIIFWLLQQLECWTDAHIMMQKEVAERITASVGTKSYGRLTVVTAAYLNAKYCFSISPNVFSPKPKVKSAVIRFTQKKYPLVKNKNFKRFNNIVSAAFNQRRKMLSNSLSEFDISDDVKMKVDFSRRPETLDVKEFVSLV